MIRPAAPADLGQLVEIRNEFLTTRTSEWRDQPYTVEELASWLAAIDARGFAALVAVEGDEVVGVASYGDFRDSTKWPGYRFTVEHSIHVRGDRHGRGHGRELLGALCDHARSAGKRIMVAAVDGDNQGSITFHERCGFTEVARMPGVGFKFDRWLDLVLLQRSLV